MAGTRSFRLLLLLFLLLLAVPAAFAQQTGSIGGRVTADGAALPGVTVEARSTVLPQPRVTTTDENGEYRLPALVPGRYTLTFSLAGMETRTREVQVLLDQTTDADVTLGVAGLSESITVTADSTVIDTSTAEIKSAVGSEAIDNLPVTQDYRDLVKLAPAVQYSEEAIRGPSSGGSGQDNVYQFDGVNVNLPLFGTAAAEPATHDIQQISVVKGGARAIDFNRAAGFTIDSVSKSGTSEFMGEVSYQYQSESFAAERRFGAITQFAQDRTWLTGNLGGPIVPDRLFFYASYYHPEKLQTDRVNNYGPVPDFESTRDEFFGKLTYTPLASVLLNGSYRHSDREDVAAGVASASTAGTASSGNEGGLRIGILEASWVINNRSYLSGKFTDFANLTFDRPDTLLDVVPSLAAGTRLDINNLTGMGRLTVPTLLANTPANAATNAARQALIDRYGFVNAQGVRTGGGLVGVARDISQQDFFRTSWQIGYDTTLGSNIIHDLHAGYQWFRDEEDLARIYNGWGDISVQAGATNCPAAATTCAGQPVHYTARFIRGALTEFPVRNIHSEYASHIFEVNDTIRWNDWSFNAGVLLSEDTLYGQGLREGGTGLTGFVAAPGNQYEMYKIPFSKMIQPRVGASWAYNGQDNVYVNYARYNPATSSLPRAASWDRNTVGLFYDAFFDAGGNLIGFAPVGSSSGKLFVDDLDPRYTDEYLIGTAQQFSPNLSARVYGRYRYSTNFWEDTNNDARARWAPEGYPKELYIPDVVQRMAELGVTTTNSLAYVITELDGGFSKYYEATAEAEWRKNRMFVRGSYTWSHYYGNFDQDNTTTVNDANSFIGSSNVADGPGRQLWDNKYGDLRGDRRHILKVYGYYTLPWNATAGAFALYQSGQPWEQWNWEVYRTLPGFSGSSDLIRYAEPSGSRRAEAHYQLDFTYTQTIPLMRGYNLQLQADVFNLTDRQTGYNIQPQFHQADYGQPRSYYEPRRFQLSAKVQF